MSSQNTIPGTARQKARSRSGQALERGYVYLTPDLWERLYALSGAAQLSASQYIAQLIPTAHGTSKNKDQNDSQALANK